jgi:hypothetical protein
MRKAIGTLALILQVAYAWQWGPLFWHTTFWLGVHAAPMDQLNLAVVERAIEMHPTQELLIKAVVLKHFHGLDSSHERQQLRTLFSTQIEIETD